MWSWRTCVPVLGTELEKGMLSLAVHQGLQQVPGVQTKSQGWRLRKRSFSFRDRPLLKPPGRNETDQEEWVELKEKKARSKGKNTGQDKGPAR